MIEALRPYRAPYQKLDVEALAQFSRIDRVQKVMRPYSDAIL